MGLLFSLVLPGYSATGKIIKVLPHYLDLEGRHAVSPSLYDRDAYQAQLRKNRNERSGLRFDIQWKASGAPQFKLRLELRGMQEKVSQSRTFEMDVKKTSLFSRWTKISLTGEDYKQFGELSAWRATLWDGDQKIGEQKSFLWESAPAKSGK